MSYIGPAPKFGAFEKQTLTPDSILTTFNLDFQVPNSQSVVVSYNDIIQEPGVDYDTGGSTITFTFTPQTGIVTWIMFLGSSLNLLVPAVDSVSESALKSEAVMKRGFIDGLQLGNTAGDLINDIDISIGECTDSSNTNNMILTTLLAKRIDATWAVGTGNGGFPSGLSGGLVQDNTWYHVFLIKHISSGVVDAGFDTSLTATNLLSDSSYDVYRRIGSVRREVGLNRRFIQMGDYVYYSTPILDYVGPSSTTRTNRTVSTPIDVNCVATILHISNQIAVGTQYGIVNNPDLSDITPSSTVRNTLVVGNDVGGINTIEMSVLTNTSSEIATKYTNTWNSNISTSGYKDFRGKQ